MQEGQGPASFGGPNKKARPEVSLADAPGLFSNGSASAQAAEGVPYGIDRTFKRQNRAGTFLSTCRFTGTPTSVP